MAKRLLESNTEIAPKIKREDKEEVLTPLMISDPIPNTTVEAVILSLLSHPRYFDGELTDGEKIIRFVAFDTNQGKTMDTFFKKKTPVSLQGCRVQYNKTYHRLEVVVKSYTKISPSTRKFKVENLKTVGATRICISDLPKMNEYDRVVIQCHVIKLDIPKIVGGGKRKQDVTIADKTGSAILTVWERDIGTIKLEQSYQFNRVTVRTFQGKINLSLPSTGATVEEIEDLEDIVTDTSDEENTDEIIQAAKVIAVNNLEAIYYCMICKKGRLTSSKPGLGTCEDCHTIQTLNKQKLTAKLFLEGADVTTHVRVRAYEDMLKAITGKDKVTAENLLSAPVFDASYNDYHVITGISRQ